MNVESISPLRQKTSRYAFMHVTLCLPCVSVRALRQHLRNTPTGHLSPSCNRAHNDARPTLVRRESKIGEEEESARGISARSDSTAALNNTHGELYISCEALASNPDSRRSRRSLSLSRCDQFTSNVSAPSAKKNVPRECRVFR